MTATETLKDTISYQTKILSPNDMSDTNYQQLLNNINETYRTVEGHYRKNPHQWNRLSLTELKNLIESYQLMVLVRYDSQNHSSIIGTRRVMINGSLGVGGLFTIFPPYQGIGLGTLLLKEAEQYLIKNNCRILQISLLHSIEPNDKIRLLRYYSKMGYSLAKCEPYGCSPNEKMVVDCQMLYLRKEI